MKFLIENIEYNKSLILIFVDFGKLFDWVHHGYMLRALIKCSIDQSYKTLLDNLYVIAQQPPSGSDMETFRLETCIRQGDSYSPLWWIEWNEMNEIEWIEMKSFWTVFCTLPEQELFGKFRRHSFLRNLVVQADTSW